MDIGSKTGYPSSALSNFAPHKFIFEGVECSSMEGWLQSLKSRNHDVQIERCKLVGLMAKRSGSKINWQREQLLWWKGVSYRRQGVEYQHLLDRAYHALAKNEGFRRALLATGDAVLTHNIGRTNEKETVLTRTEFCSRLIRLRGLIRREMI